MRRDLDPGDAPRLTEEGLGIPLADVLLEKLDQLTDDELRAAGAKP